MALEPFSTAASSKRRVTSYASTSGLLADLSVISNLWKFKACLSKLHACRCHASAGTVVEPPLEVQQKSTEGKNVVEVLRSRGLVQVFKSFIHHTHG